MTQAWIAVRHLLIGSPGNTVTPGCISLATLNTVKSWAPPDDWRLAQQMK